jgi:hypothetical protein
MPFICVDLEHKYKCPPKKVTYQKCDTDSVNKFIEAINDIDFTLHISTSPNCDPDTNFDSFKSLIDDCVEKHLPFRTVKFNRYRHKLNPWITSGILKSIKNRDKMYKNMKLIDPDSERYDSCKRNIQTYNNIIKKLIRNSKISYYNNMFTKHKNDSSKSWKLLNSLLGHSNKKNVLTNIFSINGSLTSNETLIADKLNAFFSNIGHQYASKIPDTDPNAYFVFLVNPPNCQFSFRRVTEQDVCKIISNFKPKNSSGDDNLSLKVLKSIGEKLSIPLSILINQSLSKGVFPHALKLAKVVPLYKKENPFLFNNYRPISLLLSLSKVFEKAVHSQLLEYFTINNLFLPNQYGFRPKYSTETATLELVDRVLQLLDDDKIPFCIFMDLSKAFDTLNHNILLKKLSFYGVSNSALSWFGSYLNQRNQYVKFHDTKSSVTEVSLGVPQGSILGPLLFLIYVNDINNASSMFKYVLYADDTTLISTFCSFCDTESAELQINNELNKIYQWLCANKLSLNIGKTKYMIFHSPHRKEPNIDFHAFSINGTLLERTNEFNFLGSIITSNLSWKKHCSMLCNKLSRTIGTLKRLQNTVPTFVLLTIYNSFFLSHLSQSILLWGHKPGRVIKLQKRAIRTIFKTKYNAHTSKLFKMNKLLKFDDIYRIAMIKFYYKYLQGTLPSYFDGMFDPCPSDHNYNTRQTNPRFPQSKKVFASKCIRYLLPDYIKELPRCISEKFDTHSLNGIGNYSKQHFYKSYNDVCSIVNCYVCNT